MSTASILTLNFVLHSLLIAAAGWFIVRFLLRGAMRRAIAANMVLLFALIGPFNIATWPASEVIERPPVYGTLQQTLTTDWPDWRIAVSPAKPATSAPQAEKPRWTLNDLVTAARWIVLSITVLLLLRLLIQSIRIQRWAWQLRDLSAQEHAKIPAGLSVERLSVFDGDCTPCVAGWFRPIIAVPAAAFEKLTPQQWRWLLRHEAEHLRCGDTTAVLLQNILRALLWWNPFVHALVEEYTQSREEACDAAALGETAENSAYAAFLLECAETCSAAPALLVPIIHTRPAKRLKARLTALMEARGTQKIGALFALACVAFAMLAPFIAASFGIATAQAQPKQPEKMYTRLYQVPPDFGGSVSAQEFLEKRGVPFPEGSSIMHQKATSTLLVRHWPANLDSIEEIIARASQQSPQVYFQVKLIQSGTLLSQHGAILQKDAFEKLIRDASQQKGIDILSAPSVTTKPGQRATVEVIRDILKQPSDKDEMKKLGPSIELLAAATDTAKSRVDVNITLGLDANEGWQDPHVGWEHVTLHKTSGKAELASGETLVLHLTTPKKPITVFITTTAINPAGKETSFDDKGPRPAPGRNMPDKPALELSERTYLLPAQLQKTTNPVAMLREQKFAVAPDGASIQDGKLTVKASKATLEMIEVWLNTLHSAQERANKQILLPVKAVSVNMPWEEFQNILVSGEVKKTSDSKPAKPAPQGVFLSGVLTDPQFQVIMRSLSRKKGISLKPLPTATVKSGVDSTADMPAEFGGQKLVITPTLGADGNTIDLNISVKPGITTSVTIWDGQTVVLSAPTGQTTRCLFISAYLISPLEKK